MKNTLKTMARKMRTKKEIKEKVPIFQTEAWDKRKKDRQNKVENKIKKAQEKKAERNDEVGNNRVNI